MSGGLSCGRRRHSAILVALLTQAAIGLSQPVAPALRATQGQGSDTQRAESQPETIAIWGQKTPATGKNLLIGDFDFEKDFDYWWQKQADLRVVNQTQMSPTGFAIPQARGRDGAYTKVFVGDTLLDDPNTSWPDAADLDLRFFEQTTLISGPDTDIFAPPSPVVSLRCAIPKEPAPNTQLGLSSGPVYGQSVWGMTSGTASEAVAFKGYYRRHTSQGRYAIYDDNLTPTNPNDDRSNTLKNNQQASNQWLGVASYQRGNWQWFTLGRYLTKSRGLAPPNPHVTTEATNHQTQQLVVVGAEASRPPLGLDQLSLAGAWRTSQQDTQDHGRLFLPQAAQQTLASTSKEGRLQLAKNLTPALQLGATGAVKLLTVTQVYDRDLTTLDRERQRQDWQWGARVHLGRHFFYLKNSYWLTTDQESAASAPEGNDAPRGQAQELTYKILLPKSEAYLQMGNYQVAPDLRSRFGDGQGTQPNATIKPESIAHREAGVSWRPLRGLGFDLRYFADRITDKIIVVPVALGRQKAINISESWYRGWHLNLTAHHGPFGYSGSGFWLHARQGIDQQLLVPNIAERYQAHEVSYQQGQWAAFANARHQTDVFFDTANQQRLPGHWETGCGLAMSQEWRQLHQLHEWSLSVFNLTDIKRLPYETPQESGYVPYAHQRGAPLPGRHYKLSWTVTWR